MTQKGNIQVIYNQCKYSRKCNVKVHNIKRQPNSRRDIKKLMEMRRQYEEKHQHNRANKEKKPRKI